ncbi:D-malate degradation protein R [Serratia fonticola]|uniref:D-malate degradation protein R n=1 Tax=Serratia fonticola TaxID=47917 RepID=A0A448T6Y3_SERFO|nr:D-malate degradation protein R [Serratia fonticola]
MKITLEELLAYTSVVDSGSITAAAEQLGQTTSGISRALSRLEKKLDTTLLRRTTRRLELTEEGRAFWPMRGKLSTRWNMLRNRWRYVV